MPRTNECLDFRNDPAYIRGLKKIEEWHEICRERRLGMPEARRKLEEKMSVSLSGYIDHQEWANMGESRKLKSSSKKRTI